MNNLLRVPVIISCKNGMPAIELRRCSTNEDIIKLVVSAAFHKQPLTIVPTFTDEIKSLSSLVEKGILIKKEKEYFFNI